MNKISLAAVVLLVIPVGAGGCDAPPQSSAEQNATNTNRLPAVPTPIDAESLDPEPKRLIRPEDLPVPLVLSDEDWPQYRGGGRDGIAQGATRLARAWAAEGPPRLWEVSVGQGYAAPAVVNGKVFLNDYDEQSNLWMVRCFSLEDGEELWTYEVKKRIRPNHAITRSMPASDGGFIFSLDPKCELHCLDARHGSLIWKKHLPTLYQTTIPPWYNGQCPLLDDEKLIVATGGSALLVAIDKRSGEPIWETPNSDGTLMSHSSIVPFELNGVRQYAYLTLKGLIGVSAETGDELWKFPWKFNTAVSPSPVPLGEGRLFLTSGYHAQSVICQIIPTEDGWETAEVKAFPPPPNGWNSEVHTPIFHRGHIFGVGKTKRGMWTCLDLSGKVLWTSGRQATFGMGGYLLADGLFIALDGKSGAVRLIDASADSYRQLAEAKLLSGPDVWAPPVVSNGKLLIRDLNKLLCLDIADHNPSLVSKE